MRSGVRAGRATIVVFADRPRAEPVEVRVGFVVSKAVGSAVTRNRVRRRLRHLARPLLAETPPGTFLVVRALPPAADATVELSADLTGAWRKCLGRLGVPA